MNESKWIENLLTRLGILSALLIVIYFSMKTLTKSEIGEAYYKEISMFVWVFIYKCGRYFQNIN